MSLDCKLVPVQYREYEIGLLRNVTFIRVRLYKVTLMQPLTAVKREKFAKVKQSTSTLRLSFSLF